MPIFDREYVDGTRHAIYPWNQSKASQIENPQERAFIGGVNLKSQID
ncbi:hypothetical protein QUA80_13165 [Microcoleus sp. F4-D5]